MTEIHQSGFTPVVLSEKNGVLYFRGKLFTNWVSVAGGNYNIPNGENVELGTVIGTQFGTAATQKLAFYGATPVVRQAALTAADAGTVASGDATTDGVINNLRTRLGEIEARLHAYGLLP
jgi:hypothetical protein